MSGDRRPAPQWRAEVDLDDAGVRDVLGRQFPELGIRSLRRFAEGWDNSLWLVNRTVAFRFPRRGIAIPGVEREIRVLPALAGRLPLPIPVPVYVGTPSEAFPWPFFGGPLLPGEEPARVPVVGDRAAIGTGLGAFLRALHDPAALAAHGSGLPDDPMGRADMPSRVARTRAWFTDLASAGIWTVSGAADDILAAAEALGPPDGRALVHGDLHVRHLLLAGDGAPSAVIDWGDICVGDPSIDLPLYWSLLDPDGRRAFRAAYGETTLTAERLLRARVLALSLDAALALYADDTGDRELLAQTLADLERTLVDG